MRITLNFYNYNILLFAKVKMNMLKSLKRFTITYLAVPAVSATLYVFS